MVLGAAVPSALGWPRHRVERRQGRCAQAQPRGWSLVAAGESPDARWRRWTTAPPHEPAAVSEAVSAGPRLDADAPRARRRRALGPRRHRQAAVAAVDEPGRAGRSDSLGGRAIHSVRPERSPARLPGRQQHAGDASKSTLDVLLVAAKRDRIDDRAGVVSQSRPPAGRDRHRGVRARQRLSDELSRSGRTRSRR